MKKIITTTLALTLFASIFGCEKTEPNEPKTWTNAPQRLGSGLEGATVGPVNAVKSGAKAVGTGAKAVGDALSGKQDEKD